MSDFFTYLAGQVLQPATEIIPAIAVHFAPGPSVPGGGLTSEASTLDAPDQPAPAGLTGRMAISQPPPSPFLTPNPAFRAAGRLPIFPAADRALPVAGAEQGSRFAAAVPVATPEVSQMPSPAPSSAMGHSPAGPSGERVTAGFNAARPEPAAPRTQEADAAEPTTVLPLVRAAVGFAPPAALPASDAVGEHEPPAVLLDSEVAVRPEVGHEPLLEQPVPPGPGAGPAAPKNPVPDPLAMARPETGRLAQFVPLASAEAGRTARTAGDAADAAMQKQPPQTLSGTLSNFQPEILPPARPAGAEMTYPLLPPSPGQPARASRAASDAPAAPALPETIVVPAAAIELSRESERSSRPDPGETTPWPLAAAAAGAPQAQAHPRRAQASPLRSPAKAAAAQPILELNQAAEPSAPVKPEPPLAMLEARQAPEPEKAAGQPSRLPEIHPISTIRPVLAAEPAAPSLPAHAGEPAIPTVHLTIGRIVVRSAPPATPAAPRPAAARRQPTVSLSDYLARHGEDH